ncbi:MAG: nucleotide exchange factor GrpE, partial [Xenococcaceae cyanobacterium]
PTQQPVAPSQDRSESEPRSPEQEQIIADFQKEIENLLRQLEQERQQHEVVKAQYARLAADLENIRKRHEKEKEALETQAKRSVITELLPVVDNFERARLQIKPNNEGEKVLHNSYQGVYKTLVDSLKRLGVSAMRPEGQPFDPNFHEAMLREATNEHPEGTVLEQLMRGYILGEQVLRHAMVKVAVPSDPVITSEGDNRDEELNIQENQSS